MSQSLRFSVVNPEFELVPAPTGRNGMAESGTAEAEATTGEPAAQAQSPVHEAERIMRRRSERLLRIWAH